MLLKSVGRAGKLAGRCLFALTLSAVPALAGSADIAAGERLFRSQCMGCHSVEPDVNRAGPSLHGVFGRRSGSLEGFEFSPAMAEAEIEWAPDTLDTFLADPSAVVPGTKMVFWGLQAEHRRQVIAYLRKVTQ